MDSVKLICPKCGNKLGIIEESEIDASSYVGSEAPVIRIKHICKKCGYTSK